MDRTTPIDLDHWPRREHFEHYRSRVPCTYSLTVELDATTLSAALRRTGRKTYPAQIWAIASVVNDHDEFRMSVDEAGSPSVWSVVHPFFTVFNPERETFAAVWADYDRDFARFHDRAVELLTTHRAATTMFPQGEVPPNVFDVSSLPWASFTGFTLNIAHGTDHYLPIVTLGRYVERDGRVMLPLAMQIHHASADGFHTARFVTELQGLMDSSGDWLG
ncbi:type A chloramphenicol O-acetyltransferase [Compostimonas suwonensis]|uniref:Chloramphenicol acetyltransferase n=1 Tax=Compostimonas suwonensis TaxID=1048394 RepID=A0A2M9BCL4_9MICO|nr:type A chloramphenicol O-acetyltransferase [Compostimonas suwonensis]PJJ55644.1 chloramphenicol O-acetyltransferase type A [Compostimonas suwonensis]